MSGDTSRKACLPSIGITNLAIWVSSARQWQGRGNYSCHLGLETCFPSLSVSINGQYLTPRTLDNKKQSKAKKKIKQTKNKQNKNINKTFENVTLDKVSACEFGTPIYRTDQRSVTHWRQIHYRQRWTTAEVGSMGCGILVPWGLGSVGPTGIRLPSWK